MKKMGLSVRKKICWKKNEPILHYKDGNVRFYTRDIDDHDFEYLWMNNSAFRDEFWFQYYVKVWKFIITDDDTGEIETEEDPVEEGRWVHRPERP